MTIKKFFISTPELLYDYYDKTSKENFQTFRSKEKNPYNFFHACRIEDL